MNRRGFLSLLAPAAALLVAPDLLLSRKTVFLPPAGGWGDHMTATEILQRMHEAWQKLPPRSQQEQMLEAMLRHVEKIVNPPLAAMMDDFAVYGTGVLKMEPGAIVHVPVAEYKQYVGFSEFPTGQRITRRVGLPEKTIRLLRG